MNYEENPNYPAPARFAVTPKVLVELAEKASAGKFNWTENWGGMTRGRIIVRWLTIRLRAIHFLLAQ